MFATSAINDWVVSQGSKKEDIKVSIEKREKSAVSGAKISYTVGVAKEALKSGDVMYTFPMGACIDAKKATNVFNAKDLTQKLSTGELGMIALLLLSERAAGGQSKYATYIRELPEAAPGVLGWPDAELEQCFSSTTRQMQRQIAAIDRDAELLQGLAAAGELSMLSADAISRDAFRWAMGIVKSRNVIVDDRAMLVPGTRNHHLILLSISL